MDSLKEVPSNKGRITVPTPVVVVILFIIGGVALMAIVDAHLNTRESIQDAKNTSAEGVKAAEQLVQEREIQGN